MTPGRPYGLPVYQFVYVSSEVITFTEERLQKLLEISRRKNSECGVTGLLLYVNGNFIQLLEGAKKDVLVTISRIRADNRHRGMNTLLDAECEKRDFENWSMGFKRVDGLEAETFSGYSEFLSRDNDPSAQASAARQMLAFFKEITR
jgi:hypothetical protein